MSLADAAAGTASRAVQAAARAARLLQGRCIFDPPGWSIPSDRRVLFPEAVPARESETRESLLCLQGWWTIDLGDPRRRLAGRALVGQVDLHAGRGVDV